MRAEMMAKWGFQSLSRKGIELVNGVAEALPSADLKFDFALMVTTICFLDNIKAAFLEAS